MVHKTVSLVNKSLRHPAQTLGKNRLRIELNTNRQNLVTKITKLMLQSFDFFFFLNVLFIFLHHYGKTRRFI